MNCEVARHGLIDLKLDSLATVIINRHEPLDQTLIIIPAHIHQKVHTEDESQLESIIRKLLCLYTVPA